MLTFGSLFSGCGCFDLGLERAGMKPAWQWELDPKPRSVLERHWPEVSKGEDVRDCRESTGLIRPDVITAGWPCQDLSVAGRRAGLAGEKSGLFREVVRILGEFRPRWFIGENVPGLLSSGGGRDMGTVLSELVQLRYGVAWRVLDAQHFGLAQRRKRVFFVGCLGDAASAAKILFESESVYKDSAPSREAEPDVAGTLDAGTGGERRGSGQNPSGLTPDVETFIAATLSSGSSRSSNQAGRRCEDDVNLVATLNSGGNNGGFRTEPGEHLVAYGIGSDAVDRSGECSEGTAAGRSGLNILEDCQPTLRARPNNSVAVASIDTNPYADHAAKESRLVSEYTGVRRLTPRECERLMGLPDDWTRWDAAGNEISDSARYRMIGNGGAVPIMEWIGKRIIEHSEKTV